MDRHRATYISMIEVTEKIDTTFHLMKLISFFFATKIDKNKCNRDIVFPLLKKKNFLPDYYYSVWKNISFNEIILHEKKKKENKQAKITGRAREETE